MREDLFPLPAVDHAENWSRHLPGFQLTHVIRLVSIASMEVVSRVAAHLKDQQVCVSSFVVLRSGNILDQKIVLDGIGERQTQLLREKLLALDGVLRIRLEHLFVRPDPGKAVKNDRQSDRATRELAYPC